MIRQPFRAPARFYVGDDRNTDIVWSFAPPGAAYYTGPTPFHPWGREDGVLPLAPGECGELFTRRRRYGNFGLPGWLDGASVCGTADDFAGRSPVPADDGRSLTCPCQPPGFALSFTSDRHSATIDFRAGAVRGSPTAHFGTVDMVAGVSSWRRGAWPSWPAAALSFSSVHGSGSSSPPPWLVTPRGVVVEGWTAPV